MEEVGEDTMILSLYEAGQRRFEEAERQVERYRRVIQNAYEELNLVRGNVNYVVRMLKAALEES